MTEIPRPEGADDLNRLSAADPESGAPSPDLSDVRARVIAQAADTPQRRKGMLIAAGVAAACALLAGTAVAGVAIGRSSAPVVVALDATAQSGDGSARMVGPGLPAVNGRPAQPGAAPGAVASVPAEARNSMGGVADAAKLGGMSYMPYWGYGNQVFVAGNGVSTTSPGTATAYLIDAEGVDRIALAKTLADAFGVKGVPVEDEYGNVTVGTSDGSGPQVWVSSDPLVSWSYYNPKVDPYMNCVYDDVPMERGQEGGASIAPVPAPDEAVQSSGSTPDSTPGANSCEDLPAPDAAQSQKQAEQIFAKLGIGDLEWQTEKQGPMTVVYGWQLVEGMRTQLSSSISFAEKGVQSAYGNAAGVTPIVGYPVISPKEAIDRSALPQWRAFGPSPDWGTVYPMAADSMVKSGSASASPAPAGAERDGRPVIEVPVQTVTLSGGDKSLVQYWQTDGTMMLLPAYQFTDGDGATWNVISVAESAVDFSTP